MASQFFGLNVAYTGLLASNAALNTTSNNISNVQTEGYSRQEVKQQASTPIRVFQTYGCAGAGVETLAIERIRDEFYDSKFWRNETRVGEYDVKQYYMKQVETYFDDDGKNSGFKTVFDQFLITGLEELMKNPNSANTKSQFVGYAGALAEYFNGLAGNLNALQKDLNQELKLKVDQINSLASEIATLNTQINTIELSGVKANELRDKRTLILDELSKLVDVEVSENPIVDANNPERETGANRFLVKIAGGQILVDASEYNGLECKGRESYEKVNQTDIDGLYDVYWKSGEKFNLYNAALGGALRGLVELRDGNNGEYFNGMVTSTGTAPDGIHDQVTVRVEQGYLQDLDKCNLSDQGGVLNLGNQLFYYDSWSYSISYDANQQPVYEYTFQISGSDKNDRGVTNDRVGKPATIGSAVKYQGVPYYMSQMNEWLRNFCHEFNDKLISGFTSDNRQGAPMFSGNEPTGQEQFDFPAANRYDKFGYDDFVNKGKFTVSVSDDSYYRLTAANVSIVAAMELDPTLMANKFKQGDGVEQNDLLEALKNLVNDKNQMSFRGASASEFLQGILSDVALNASRANSFHQNFKDISASIDNQRISISGVDEDEEAVNLVKYQNGYNLASKMIQVLTEIYDRLILQTGV